MIRAIWDNSEHAVPLGAINEAVPGGTADVWHQFALDNWNRPPLDNYTAWDQLQYQLNDSPFIKVDLGGQHSRSWLLRGGPSEGPADISHLSSAYRYITVPDDNVEQITLTHYGYTKTPGPGIRIDALIELADGTFEQQDWTDGADKTFCLEKPGQDVQSLLLMYSDGSIRSEAANFPQADAKLTASDACIPTGFTGTVTNTLTIANSSQSLTQQAQAKVTYSFDPKDSLTALGDFLYNTASGTVHVSVSGGSGGCSISGATSFAIPAWKPPVLSGPGGQISTGDGISAKSHYYGTGTFTNAPPIPATWVCPSGTFTAPYAQAGMWWQTNPKTPIRKGQILSGSLTTTQPGGVTEKYTWRLTPVF